jgi:signal transduction histidine kinase
MATDKGEVPAAEPTWPFASALHECLVAGVVLIDSKDQATLTPEAEQMLRLPVSQGLHQPRSVLPVPLVAVAQQAIASGQPISCRTVEMSLADGTKVNLQVSAIPLTGADRKTGVVLVLNNLGRAKHVTERLLELDRRANVGTLAASIAHEIKNALVACRTFVDLLLEQKHELELVETVRREMRRVDDLVTRMLKHSAPAARVAGPVHLHQVLEHSLRLLQPQLDSKSIEVQRSFDSGSDLLTGDAYELQQAFMNLLLNALEAVALNGTLRVQTRRERGGNRSAELCIDIIDNGTGIGPENLTHLFEPFFTTKPSGTGLGLAITHRIIGEHNGRITVESKLNQGTTFRVFLPT